MSAEDNLHDILSENAPVFAVVGDRIYPDYVPPDKDLPAIAFNRTGTTYIPTIHGGVTQEDTVTFEIFCTASSHGSAKSLGDLVAAIEVMPPKKWQLLNRLSLYDSETGLSASVITVNVDP
jgi:hypothetical protein